ncbi:MAG: hypothetical protein GY856_53385 [bacterium]|nr:hypothetical protein [bacterium]
MSRLAPLVILLLLAAVPLAAQGSTFFNQRDDQYTLLGLKRAKEAYDIARTEYERQEQLFAANLLSQSALDAARRSLSEAEVNFQQSLLAVLFEQQYVAVMAAVKYQSDGGRKNVRLQLENTSGGSAEYRRLVHLDDELFRALQPEVIHDVYVSLANGDGAIISQPYEAKVEELRYGRPAELEFGLLQDVDAVTVNLAYGQNAQRSVKIFLQKDSSVDRVAVQSEQFSQEVELGASATFDLTLELYSGRTDTYQLAVVGLPSEVHRYFVDPASQARLSQFKFTETTHTRSAALQVFLPDRDSPAVAIDESIPFYVLVIPRQGLEALGTLDGRRWSEDEVAALGVGFVRLELVPRGVGRLRVKAPVLYFQVGPEDEVEVVLEVINEGTRRLDNVELDADPPLGWRKTVAPAVVTGIEAGEEKTVHLRLRPPADVAVGKYETRVRTTSYSDNQPIEAEDKTVTVEIRPAVSIAPSVVLILSLIGLILGVVVFGVRLARR